MRYSKGVMWLDDCRIPFLKDEGYNYKNGPLGNSFSVGEIPDGKRTEPVESNPKGRFTPNLLVCDDMLNDGVITKQSKRTYKPTEHTGSLFGNSPQAHGVGIGDTGSSSRYYDLDMWFNKLIDEINYVL
jgi:hypothetical protein